jgi:Domain of unknown function (DUF4330)
MAILDSKGRLFGKLSILDAAAALIILMVAAGIFLLPGKTSSFAQGMPIEVDLIVRGLNTSDPKTLLKLNDKINIIIRNEPSGTAELIKIQHLPRNVTVPQPDGTVKALPDPRPEARFSNDMILTLKGIAKEGDDGSPVLGNKKVKVGASLELEGPEYNFNSTIIVVRKGSPS